MDEELKAAEEAVETSNAEVADDNSQQNSQSEEQTTEEAEGQEEEVATESEGQEAETEESPKKGAQTRIKELVKERNEAREEAKSLETRMAELTNQVGSGGEAPFTPQYQSGQEVSPEQLSQDVAKTANAIVELRIKQSEAVNRINNESHDVIRKYDQLNPESENFDQELSETVTEATEAFVKSAPYTASVSKFVDKLMKPYQRSVAKEAGKASENIAKQVSQAALRPSSVRKQEKDDGEKSLAELEAELGVVNS